MIPKQTVWMRQQKITKVRGKKDDEIMHNALLFVNSTVANNVEYNTWCRCLRFCFDDVTFHFNYLQNDFLRASSAFCYLLSADIFDLFTTADGSFPWMRPGFFIERKHSVYPRHYILLLNKIWSIPYILKAVAFWKGTGVPRYRLPFSDSVKTK